MLFLYTILMRLALPFILLRLWWKSLRNAAYRQRLLERFGFGPALSTACIWVHAVSVGEVAAAAPLVAELLKRHPELSLVLTTMTPTGAARVQALFKERVVHRYVPYDVPSFIERFMRRMQPRLLVLIETELWPNLLYCCARQAIPTVLLNARLSARSAAGYGRFKTTMAKLLQQITRVAAQYEADGERLVALGLPRNRLHVTGSVKFDLALPTDLTLRAQTLKASWDAARPVWIAASTHAGEEEIILQSFVKLQIRWPTLLLILVPRHQERFSKVSALAQCYADQIILRSSGAPVTATTQIYIGDTMGELLLLYACADVAFIGGSLVKTGGHNPLEAAALGVPIIVGPHVFNFAAIVQALREASAITNISTAAELPAAVTKILADQEEHARQSAAGLKVMEANRGALAKQLALIETCLQH